MNLEIGAKIKQLRLARGLTQEQLGKPLRLSAQAVSKWESGATMPDIQLLPELSVQLGVTIDELFSMTDRTRMDRIDNMLEDVRYLPAHEFENVEQYLKDKITLPDTKAEATLLLARLYNKRAREYRELATPIAREALLLNPNEKEAHKANLEAAECPMPDWNVANRWQLIAFYQEFVRQHPDSRSNYLWLMDLLLEDGRTAEARDALEAMGRVERTYHYDLYDGLIAKEEGNLPRALDCWKSMTDKEPKSWMAWFCRADSLAKLARYDEATACYERAFECSQSPGSVTCRRPWPRFLKFRAIMPWPSPCGSAVWRSARKSGTSPKGKPWTSTAGKFSACGSVWPGNNKRKAGCAGEIRCTPFDKKAIYSLHFF